MVQSRIKFESLSVVSRRLLFSTSLAVALGAGSSALGQTGTLGAFTPLQIPVLPVVQRSTPKGATSASQVLHLSINLLPSSQAGLQAFADSVSDPKSPNFHKFITPAQVGQMFGQSASMVQKLTNYFKSQGFTIKLVAQSRMGILADCTVGQAEAAFNTTIENYHALSANELGKTDYYCYTTPPELPASVATAVLSVEGLQSFTKPKPTSTPLNCTQTRVLYNSAPVYKAGYQGQGRHVGISNWDGYLLSNVPLYYKMFSLPTPPGGLGSNITVITIDGGSGSSTAQGEGDLDIQMELGMAPLASFLLYDGGQTFVLTDVLTKEQDDNAADIISESWEWNLPPSDEMAAHNLHLMMTTQGMTYIGASGDYGTAGRGLPYPHDDPEVLSVGGTQPEFDGLGNRLTEPCWTGSGGGWQTETPSFNVLPSWQKGTGVPTNVPARLIPDVAFCAAGNNTGAYQFFYNGAINEDYDGTSFASPVFAGMLTIAEQMDISLGGLQNPPHRLGRVQDLIYSQNGRPDVWFDVTQGSNGILPNGAISNAAPGWDFTSGWGCMNVYAFVQSIAVTPAVLYSPSAAAVFDNTYVKPAVVEGAFVSGTVANLAKADGQYFVVSPVKETGLGQIAAAQASFTTTLTPSSVASMSLSFTGSVPAPASVMVYIYNWSTNLYEYLNTVSGTQFGLPNTIAISSKPISKYVSATGQVQTLVRALVPTDRQTEVGQFSLKVDQLQLSTTALLKG